MSDAPSPFLPLCCVCRNKALLLDLNRTCHSFASTQSVALDVEAGSKAFFCEEHEQ